MLCSNNTLRKRWKRSKIGFDPLTGRDTLIRRFIRAEQSSTDIRNVIGIIERRN